MTADDLGLEPFESDPQLAHIAPEKISKSYAGAKRMSEKYVEKGPYEFFPDAMTVELVQRGLAKNELLNGKRYCPWMTLSGDPAEDRLKICPCDRHHEDIARDGFCIWMFFVSEEFLRKYEAGEAFGSTLDEVTEAGESLFPDAHGGDLDEAKKSKAERAEEARRRTEGTSGPAV